MTGFWIGFLSWPALSLAIVLFAVLMYQIDRWQQRRRERRRDREAIDAAIQESAHALQFPPLSRESRDLIWERIKDTLEQAREDSA